MFDHIRAAITHPDQLLPANKRSCCAPGSWAARLRKRVGKVTGDKSTENEGKGDQTKSNLKDAGE